MGRKIIAYRSRVAAVGVRIARRFGAAVSMGFRASHAEARQFRFPSLGSGAGPCISRGRQRLGRFESLRKWMGMDFERIRIISRISAVSVLSRLFRKFL